MKNKVKNTVFSTILGAALLILGCSQKVEPQMQETSQRSEQEWSAYLAGLVAERINGASNVYQYLLPAPDDEKFMSSHDYLLRNAKADMTRGTMKNALIAFGAPDSGSAREFAVAALTDVGVGRLRDARIMFIGNKSDGDMVRAATKNSGASFEFIEVDQ